MPAPLVPVDWNGIDAVVFDIGGVFAVRHPEPLRRGMARAGFQLPEDDGSNYHDAHYRAVHALTSQLGDDPMDEYQPGVWMHYERAYFSHLGVDDDRLEAAAHAMRDEVFLKEPKPFWRYLLSDNIAAFKKIAAVRPVAIVTNNDGTAAQQMIDFEIAQVGPGPLTSVAAIADSGLLGIAKPDPRIFDPALVALGTDRARTLYVGDTVHADVHGASAAGMPVVQLDPLDLHAEFAHCRLPGVEAIAELLGA